MKTINLTTEELNDTLRALSSYIYALDIMIDKTNEEQYWEQRNKIQNLKNLFIKTKRNLAD